jgi:hypothetical protein
LGSSYQERKVDPVIREEGWDQVIKREGLGSSYQERRVGIQLSERRVDPVIREEG